MEQIEREFERALTEAKSGLELMCELKKKYLLFEPMVLLLPSESNEEDEYAIKYLFYYMLKRGFSKCVIITNNDKVKDKIYKLEKLDKLNKKKNLIQNVVVVTDEQMWDLSRLYCMYIPYPVEKFIWGCIGYVPGRRGAKILGKKGVGIDELIRLGVYNLSEEDLSEKQCKIYSSLGYRLKRKTKNAVKMMIRCIKSVIG